MSARQLKISVVIVVGSLFLSSVSAVAAGPSPFVGHWEGIDIDGSDIRLTIGGPPDGPFQITWTESYISFCDGEAGILRGTGELNPEDPDLLETEMWVECFRSGASTSVDLSIRYHPGTGVLTIVYPNGLMVVLTHPGRPHDPPAPLQLRANYQENWVEGFYPEGYTVWVTVTEADGRTIKATAEMATGPVSIWDGEVGFSTLDVEWDPAQPDIEPYDWVYGWVNNGASAQMRLGDVNPVVDLGNNLVQGTIAADWFGEEVFVYCTVWGHEPGVFDFVLPDGDDTFICDWEGAIDITADDTAEVWYWGPDGNAVGYYLFPPPAIGLRVNYGHDWVESFYEAGHRVDLLITESDGETLKATATAFTETRPDWGGEAGFQTAPEDWQPAAPDLLPYDWVFASVDNGVTAQVQLGDIQGEVFILDDRIEGTVDAGWIPDPVQVECLDWGSGGDAGNQDGGWVQPDGSETYDCAWDPAVWDIQPWQDIGVGYFTPDGHWVANAFRAEHWVATWTYDLEAASWAEGDHSYSFDWAYDWPELSGGTTSTRTLTVAASGDWGETPIYDGRALIGPWGDMQIMAWTGSGCEAVSVIHPEQPMRLIWSWVNDYSMTYEEAQMHFDSFAVTGYWDGDGGGSSPLSSTGEFVEFYSRDARWEYLCNFTDHP